MTLELVDPLSEPRWNQWVSAWPEASFFHGVEWFQVLSECYGYRARNLVWKQAGQLRGLLPMMEVASILTGRRGVSLPFSDECRPLVSEGAGLEGLLDPMRALGKRCGWKYLELRGGAEAIPGAVAVERYLAHRLALKGSEDEQFRNIESAQRRNVRKARREGVAIERLQTEQAIRSYYELHCQTRKRQGVPPQPRRFFLSLHRHAIARGRGFVLLANHGGRPVAGGVFLHANGNAIFKFGASDPSVQHLRANSLLMWEAIVHLRRLGARELSFGRTDSGHTGLLRFKRSWGAAESTLDYRRIGLCESAGCETTTGRGEAGIAAGLLKRMPVPILQALGHVLYRHAG